MIAKIPEGDNHQGCRSLNCIIRNSSTAAVEESLLKKECMTMLSFHYLSNHDEARES